MKQTYCNPLDLGYRYQHMKEGPRVAGFREGADPTLVYFKGKYYLFVSMSAGFWYSEDLLNWDFHADPGLLIYDYAPDVRQVGNYLYFCASRKGRNCPILRTADPLTEPFTEVSAPFAFWDPDLFCDDDGRVYFYWGCSNIAPIYGVELAPDTPEIVSVDFERGNPVAVNGKALSPATIISTLAEIAGRNGIGRDDMVENRFVGMKCRGVYENPAGTLLFALHRDLEGICMDR